MKCDDSFRQGFAKGFVCAIIALAIVVLCADGCETGITTEDSKSLTDAELFILLKPIFLP